MARPQTDFKGTKPPSMAEEIVEWAFGGYRKLYHHSAPLVPFTKQHAYRVAEAQRFRVDKRASATFARMKKPDYPLAELMPFMRLRFPLMWIEFGDDSADEARQIFSEGETGKVGVLLSQEDDNKISATIIREVKTQLGFSTYMPEMAPLIISPEGVRLDFDLFLRNGEMLIPEDFTLAMGWDADHNETKILEASIKLENEIGIRLINLLLLLNSRSEVVKLAHYPETQEKANLKNRRLLQKGLKAKLPAGDITLNLSRILRRHPHLSEEAAYALIEDQLVSGHFKIRYRKPNAVGQRVVSGIYWWDYHIRNKSRPDITIQDIQPRTHNVSRRAKAEGTGFSNATGLGLPTVSYRKPRVSG